GQFSRGDAVVIRGPDTAEIGRGLVAYDAVDAAKIKGRSSAEILGILGFSGRIEMVHRDDMVLGGEGGSVTVRSADLGARRARQDRLRRGGGALPLRNGARLAALGPENEVADADEQRGGRCNPAWIIGAAYASEETDDAGRNHEPGEASGVDAPAGPAHHDA